MGTGLAWEGFGRRPIGSPTRASDDVIGRCHRRAAPADAEWWCSSHYRIGPHHRSSCETRRTATAAAPHKHNWNRLHLRWCLHTNTSSFFFSSASDIMLLFSSSSSSLLCPLRPCVCPVWPCVGISSPSYIIRRRSSRHIPQRRTDGARWRLNGSSALPVCTSLACAELVYI